MNFSLAALAAYAAKIRPPGAGALVSSGTVSNRDRAAGSCCLAEARASEAGEHGGPQTPFSAFGATVRIDLRDAGDRSVFGDIAQTAEP